MVCNVSLREMLRIYLGKTKFLQRLQENEEKLIELIK